MSIETEFESTITNVQNAYQGLDNLGATIPQNKTIENIKNCLDEIYNNLPKTAYAEGSNITLSNTLKGKLDFEDNIAGYGDTKQNSYEGYNELNIYAVHPIGYTETVSGVTIKYNNDGSVTATGTATADVNYFLGSRASLGNLFNGTYYLSGCKTGSNTTYYLSMWAEGIGVYPQTTTEVATNKTSGVNWNIVIVVKSGASVNYTFYPMMSKTSGKSFEPFVGNSPSPSPSYPQDIEVVRGKNRLPVPYAYSSQTRDGITFTINDDGSIKANGTATGNATFVLQFQSQELRNLLLKNDCMLSGCPSGGSGSTYKLQLYGYTSSGAGSLADTGSGVSLASFENETNSFNIAILILTGTTVNNIIFKPMIEIGSQVTSYLPYNTIEVVERGINFLDESTLRQGAWNGSSTKRLFFYSNYYLKAGTYTLITNLNTSTYRYAISLDTTTFPQPSGQTIDVYDSGWQTSSYKTFTITQDGYLGVGVKEANEGVISPSDISNYNFMIYEGEYDSSISYEPYQTPQTYQLSLGEYEFAKIGNYVDTIEYDVDEDKVYKNKAINVRTFDGSESWQANTPWNNSYPSTFHAIGMGMIMDNTYAEFKMTHFTTQLGRQGKIEGNLAYFESSSNPVLIIFIEASNLSEYSIQGYKNWLNINKPKIAYPLEEIVKEEITGTLKNQIKALYYSHSFTGTTIIEIDGQLPLIIKVRALKGE